MSFEQLKLVALMVWGLAVVSGVGAWSGRPTSALRAAPPVRARANLAVGAWQQVEVGELRKTTRHSAEKALVEKALARVIDFPGIDDPKTTLTEALDLLARKHRLQFEINDVAFRAEEVEEVWKTKVAAVRALEGGRMTLTTVLWRILERVPSPSGATCIARERTIEITTRAAWLEELGLSADTHAPLVVKSLRRASLAKALETVAAEAGVTLLLDVRVAKKARAPVTAHLYYVPVETALELLADMAGLAVVASPGGVYYVTSPANADRLVRKGRYVRLRAQPSPVEGNLGFPGNGLRAAIPERLPLDRALEAVADARLTTVLLDVRAQKKARVRVPHQKVLYHVPVETALELLTDMAGLAVVKKGNAYYVTSPANAARLERTAGPAKARPKAPAQRLWADPGPGM
jgi:hypothetical protein